MQKGTPRDGFAAAIAKRAANLASGDRPELAGAVLVACAVMEAFAQLSRTLESIETRRVQREDAQRERDERTAAAHPRTVACAPETGQAERAGRTTRFPARGHSA
jgi:hypothetical protein